jgi:hypothetical protein
LEFVSKIPKSEPKRSKILTKKTKPRTRKTEESRDSNQEQEKHKKAETQIYKGSERKREKAAEICMG